MPSKQQSNHSASRSSIVCYLGLGSNLETPKTQLQSAINSLHQHKNIQFLQQSHLYESDPIGPPGQPQYLNAAVKISTHLPADDLLDCLQKIELNHGRERNIRWGARTLDIDILLYGDHKINTERLTVPHIELKNRNFVLLPLADLDANLELPDGESLSSILATASTDGIKRISQNMKNWDNA